MKLSVDGNSTYYFKLEGSDTIFIGDISLSNQFPLAKVGDVVTIEYVNSKDNSEVITSIKIWLVFNRTRSYNLYIGYGIFYIYYHLFKLKLFCFCNYIFS